MRNAKMEVLRCLRPITGKDVEQSPSAPNTVKARAMGHRCPAIVARKGVNPNSTTETYVALKVFRGKLALVGRAVLSAHRKSAAQRASEIAVQFKDIPHILFNANAQHRSRRSVLTLRIQPEEGLLAPHRLACAGHPRANTPGGNGLSIQRSLRAPVARSL